VVAIYYFIINFTTDRVAQKARPVDVLPRPVPRGVPGVRTNCPQKVKVHYFETKGPLF